MRTPAFAAAALLLAVTAPAFAASFDCAKASSAAEKTICGAPALSQADEELAKVFGEALKTALNPQRLKAEQRAWLAERNKAADAASLAKRYGERIDVLKGEIARREAMPRDIAAAEAAQRCLLPTEAPSDLACVVEEVGEVAHDASKRLRYQLQGYKDGDLRLGGGVVVFAAADGKAERLVAIAAAYDESAHYSAPEIVTAPGGQSLLLLPGSLEGTGVFNADVLFHLDGTSLRSIDIESWQHELARRLPQGLAVWKGMYPDYVAMKVETALWRAHDGNCCPTGGRAWIRLALRDDRLVIEDLRVKRGPEAARAEPEPMAQSSARDDDLATDLCGKTMQYEIAADAFRNGPAQDDAPALDTATTQGPVLIHRGFRALCEAKLLSPQDVAQRIDKVVISWAGGADNFAAYFAREKSRPNTLIAEWAWSGSEIPSIEDVRDGLLCALRPKQRLCADRQP